MNEIKAVGNIGTAYEDRRNGKQGILMSRDESAKTMTFFGNGEEFTVTYAAFKSNWRKLQSKAPDPVEKEEEVVEEPSATDDAPTFVAEDTPPTVTEDHTSTDEEVDAGVKMTAACTAVGRKLDVFVQSGVTSVVLDEVTVLTAEPAGDFWALRMLPDLFTFANWKDKLVLNSIKFSLAVSDHLTVAVKTKQIGLEDIFTAITDALPELNLYGYIE